MKTIIRFILVSVIAGGAFLGCSTKSDLTVADTSTAKASSLSDAHLVGVDQVLSYIGDKRPVTKGAQSDYSLEAYLNAQGDTLMYIINYGDGDGWQVLSTDTRTPAVIAESDTGRFSLEDGSEGFRIWMDMTASDIAHIRNCRDEELSFSAEEIAAHKAFWASKKDVDGPPSRWDPDDPPTPSFGHWEVSASNAQITLATYNHMGPHWDQGYPYNTYCPFRTDTIGARAPAGCVAVAGATALKHLHDTLGFPVNMVSDGVCTGDISNPNQHFYNKTSTIWASIDSCYTNSPSTADAEALMIGYIGKCSKMNYGNDASGSNLNKLKSGLLDSLGIYCTKSDYNANTVKTYIGLHQPIIIAAHGQDPRGEHSHCFVIDGYKLTCIETTYLHYWIPGDNEPEIPGLHDPYYTYDYSEPDITKIKINWGWWTQWVNGDNDGWYSLTANWYVTTQSGSYYYNYNVDMLYGFHI